MVLAKSKKAVGLGNSLMNDRFGKGKGADMRKGNFQGGIERTGQNGERYITNPSKEASWVKMRSVTEQAALDDFLSTAELAGTDFTAEKLNNVKIIHRDQKNPWLLSAADERAAVRKHRENRAALTVPRRPAWTERTTPQELDLAERESLLRWRRGLAELQENNDLLMTPFERNLEVWRQLWRVIERSDLVVQIVDARNPLLFRSEDLEAYVKEVDARKNNLLLVNKADMMTLEQRQAWADHFEEAGISYKFFSAELAKELNEARALAEGGGLEDSDEYDDEEEDEEAEEDEEEDEEGEEHEDSDDDIVRHAAKVNLQDGLVEDGTSKNHRNPAPEPDPTPEDERTRIITTTDLESLFLAHAPTIEPSPSSSNDTPPRKTQIGLVGYPNVGKSSTINALIGAKKVSVSSTPGKTKHFQTIHLSPSIILCDCPGLVFPNFATTKAELVCSGVLPIDQLREYTGPAGLVAQRIPKSFLEAIYGMQIRMRPREEGGTGVPTSSEVLRAYASARGFQTQGLGQPDESRAARYVLKDYVKGKLLFCHPPPKEPPIDAKDFNRELYQAAHLPAKRRARLGSFAEDEDDDEAGSIIYGTSAAPSHAAHSSSSSSAAPAHPSKSTILDKKFFAPSPANAHLTQPFHHQYSEQGSAAASAASTASRGKQLSGRKLKSVAALDGVEPGKGKKHFKGHKKRAKKERAVDERGEVWN